MFELKFPVLYANSYLFEIGLKFYWVEILLTVLASAWIMHLSSHPSVQGACCLDIAFRHIFSALDCVAFDWCLHHAVRFPPCVYSNASPGVESLVGREFTQSLGTRLLVSVLRAMGAIFNLFYICFSLDNQIKVHIVLYSSSVIFTAVSYDVLILIV